MKKLLSIIVLVLSFCVNSFAMSPEFKKEIFDGCYLDAKSTLGNQRAKQYCTCTSEMLHRKFSDEEILIIGQKSQDEQMQAFSFASNYCNKNADAPN